MAFWGADPRFNKNVDMLQVRLKILEILSENETKTADIIKALRIVCGESIIKRALHHLELDGYISRRARTEPWKIKARE